MYRALVGARRRRITRIIEASLAPALRAQASRLSRSARQAGRSGATAGREAGRAAACGRFAAAVASASPSCARAQRGRARIGAHVRAGG